MTVHVNALPGCWQSELLASIPGVRHAVTRRVEGMGRAHGNIGYSPPRDKLDAWQMRQAWSDAAGLQADRLVTLGQVHGAEVHIAARSHAGAGARPGSPQIGLGDALATNEAGPVLMTLHADCQALLFVDPGNGRRGPAVAVAHAGWRGTVANVAGRTLSVMHEAFGSRPADVHVALGPAIGPCCYDVGDEVAEAWRAQAGSEGDAALQAAGARLTFSLRDANALLLARAGVRAEQMEISSVCTRCGGGAWFSHRGQGPETGRFGAMVAILE